ncbi:MAG: hypothetical protein ACLGHY_13775, partial [Gammaproteobacteria bacterium]
MNAVHRQTSRHAIRKQPRTARRPAGRDEHVFLLGYAWQRGWLPVGEAALLKAIEMNGAAVPMNQAAFAWGRNAALDLPAVR